MSVLAGIGHKDIRHRATSRASHDQWTSHGPLPVVRSPQRPRALTLSARSSATQGPQRRGSAHRGVARVGAPQAAICSVECDPALSTRPARSGRTRLPGLCCSMVHRFIRLKRCVERLRSPSSTDMATSGRLLRDRASCARLGTTSSASGAIPSQRCTGAIRRMTNASVPNSVSSTTWHAVFAGHGDLEEATSSVSQARVCEAPLATALDQRHEMTSPRALHRATRIATADPSRLSAARIQWLLALHEPRPPTDAIPALLVSPVR